MVLHWLCYFFSKFRGFVDDDLHTGTALTNVPTWSIWECFRMEQITTGIVDSPLKAKSWFNHDLSTTFMIGLRENLQENPIFENLMVKTNRLPVKILAQANPVIRLEAQAASRYPLVN